MRLKCKPGGRENGEIITFILPESRESHATTRSARVSDPVAPRSARVSNPAALARNTTPRMPMFLAHRGSRLAHCPGKDNERRRKTLLH
jgi:hypothetical protein